MPDETNYRWPVFDGELRDNSPTWSARFASYDRYHEDCYYVVTLTSPVVGEPPPPPFMIQLGMEWAGEDWTSKAFVDQLRDRLGELAALGKTNTTYVG